MAIYFASYFGQTMAGLMMLVTVITGLLSSFFGGYYADVKGRKKVLVVSEQIRFVCLLLLALVNSKWIEMPLVTFFLFLINIVLISISTPANEAIIIDVSTPDTRKYVYSISYWITNLSLAIGSMLGAFLYKSHFFELIVIISVSSLISYMIIEKYLKETVQPNVQVEKVSLIKIFKSYKPVLSNRLFMKYFLVGIVLLGIEMQLGNYISVRLAHEFGIQSLSQLFSFLEKIDGVQLFGILRTENTILVVLLISFVTRIGNRLSDRVSFNLGVILFVCGYSVVAVSNNAWILLLATLIFTLGELIYVPVFQAMFAEIVPEDARSKYAAVNKLNIRGAMMLGSFGIVIGAFLPSWLMAILYVVMGLISIYVYRNIVYHFKESKNSSNFVS